MSPETGGMPIQSSGKTPEINIPGVRIYGKPCPKCGSKMMLNACPCFIKKHGWKLCARCMNPKCAHLIGVEKSKKRR